MAAKKRKVKQTLREFRAWLEGVEELQPEGWSPNRDQWKLIRDKIDFIKEEVVEKAAVINNAAVPQALPAQHPQRALQPSMIPPAPPVGGMPDGAVNMTPAAKEMFNPGDGRAKTPNIDTSDGNVTSSFA